MRQEEENICEVHLFSGDFVAVHSPLIIKQAAALIAWKTADQRR